MMEKLCFRQLLVEENPRSFFYGISVRINAVKFQDVTFLYCFISLCILILLVILFSCTSAKMSIC